MKKFKSLSLVFAVSLFALSQTATLHAEAANPVGVICECISSIISNGKSDKYFSQLEVKYPNNDRVRELAKAVKEAKEDRFAQISGLDRLTEASDATSIAETISQSVSITHEDALDMIQTLASSAS